MKGAFAFIIYDKAYGKILAARDPRQGTGKSRIAILSCESVHALISHACCRGAEPLFWGTNLFGEGLLFATDRALIEGECADADYFPAGEYIFTFHH